MPTYEYLCKDCDQSLEVVQSFSEDPLTVCPNCEGELRKKFSAAGIIFKGSGWHIKDYSSSGSSTTSSPASGSDGGDSSSSGASSTSTPSESSSTSKNTTSSSGDGGGSTTP